MCVCVSEFKDTAAPAKESAFGVFVGGFVFHRA